MPELSSFAGAVVAPCQGRDHQPAAELSASRAAAHARLSCMGCHPGTQPGPHPSKPVSMQCEQCHLGGATRAAVAMPLIDLLHARDAQGRPNCNQCHGHHAVATANATGARTARENAAKLCGSCHENAAHAATIPQVTDYASSIHSTATVKGAAGPAATCTDCHAVHVDQPRQRRDAAGRARSRAPRLRPLPSEPAEQYSHSVHGSATDDAPGRHARLHGLPRNAQHHRP